MVIITCERKSDPDWSLELSLQSWLRPALTPVLRNRDFERRVADLTWLDHVIAGEWDGSARDKVCLGRGRAETRASAVRKKARFAIYAVCAELLQQMLGLPGFESFPMTLAGSDLLAEFCECGTIEGIRWTSKS